MPSQRAVLIARLNRDAERIAHRFELRYRAIEAERAGVNGHYGICYSDGLIRIRLEHARTGRSLKYSSLVNTLCHELAHLRHFNHGPRFRAFYLALLDFARREGIYQPGRPGERPGRSPSARPPRPEPDRRAPKKRNPPALAPAGPEQLDLF
jgi:hypothetical protein